MRIIELDSTSWSTTKDFYAALLAGLGAPKQHGHNINALTDSMIWGGINAVDPPYTIRIRGVSRLPKDIIREIDLAKQALVEARSQFRSSHGRDVQVQLET